jgi:hypothetical protein
MSVILCNTTSSLCRLTWSPVYARTSFSFKCSIYSSLLTLFSGQTRVDTHTQKRDATHKKMRDTPSRSSTYLMPIYGLFPEASGRCVVLRPREIDQSQRRTKFYKSQKFACTCARAAHSWPYQFHSEKRDFKRYRRLTTVLANYKVSLSGLDLFRHSFLGRIFSRPSYNAGSNWPGLCPPRRIFVDGAADPDPYN